MPQLPADISASLVDSSTGEPRSPRNKLVSWVRSLTHARTRRQSGYFFLDGVRGVAAAIESGHTPTFLLVCRELLVSPLGRDVVAQVRVPVVGITREAAERLGSRDDCQGLFAVMPITYTDRNALAGMARKHWLVLCCLQDPGNIGTILRTAAVFDVTAVLVVGPGADVYDPKAVRACMGSLSGTCMVPFHDPEDFCAWWHTITRSSHQPPLVSTSVRGTTSLEHIAHALTEYAVLVGNEQTGVPDALAQMADYSVRIPCVPSANSLNVSVATGIVLASFYNART